MSAPVDLENKNRVSTEDRSDYRYTNKYLNEELSFEPAGDEVVASLGSIGDESEAVGGLEALNANDQSTLRVVNAERGFAVLEVTTLETVEALDADITDVNPAANTLPVMIDGNGHRRYFMPDELTVQFAEDVTADEAEAIIAEHASAVVQKHRTEGYYTIAVPEGQGLFESLRRFADRDDVEFAEPSEIGIDDALSVVDRPGTGTETGTDTANPNPDDIAVAYDDEDLRRLLGEIDIDPETGELLDGSDELDLTGDVASVTEQHFGRLWGLHNRGQSVNNTSGTADADIDAPQAWRIERGNSRAVVAVIDTGADLDHIDLQSRLLTRGSHDWDFADPADSVPEDSGDHGTHVAGTAVGASNSTGVVGVAPGARLMPLRINLSAGMNANRADAINYVADRAAGDRNRRYVINCSWRASGNIAAILRAIRRAVARNVLVIFAAGNDNRDMDVQPQYPGAYPEVMSVAATDQNDRRAWFTNYGSTVDIAAPGVNTYSSVPGGAWGFKNGTSMAAPHVAGGAALVWSRNETLSAAQVRRILERSADNINAKNPGFENKLGSGRLNVYRALRNTPAPVRVPRVVRDFAAPQANAGSSTGLAYAPFFRVRWFQFGPALLFLTQQAGSENVYFLNPLTGAVRHAVDPSGNDTIGSLEWQDGQIWAANVTTGSGSINRINPYTGATVGSISVPAGRGEGLAHDGNRIYYSTQNRIHVINPSTGSVAFSFIPPGGQCRALAVGGGKLFIGDGSSNRIRVLDAATRIEQVIYHAPGGGDRQVEGLAYNAARRELYVANQSENRIYVIRA